MRPGALAALSAAGAYHAIDTRKITRPRARRAAGRAHHRLDRFRLPRAYFKYHFTARDKPSGKTSGDPAIEVNPVAATLEREPRLEVAHLGRQRGELSLCNVRRVGHDQIERIERRSAAFQRGEAIAM